MVANVAWTSYSMVVRFQNRVSGAQEFQDNQAKSHYLLCPSLAYYIAPFLLYSTTGVREFFYKSSDGSILGFVSYTVSVETTTLLL